MQAGMYQQLSNYSQLKKKPQNTHTQRNPKTTKETKKKNPTTTENEQKTPQEIPELVLRDSPIPFSKFLTLTLLS